MNACTVLPYELGEQETKFFSENTILNLLSKLERSSYKANFHRGNHFISILEDITDGRKYVMIHSSAAEFETTYNGLYPVEGNYIYENLKIYYSHGRYIRYLDGYAAELYLKFASNLYTFNENRHDFIISALIDSDIKIVKGTHNHHYGMPSQNEALLGCHILHSGEVSPLLTRPGKNVYLIQYDRAIDRSLCVDDRFITPHGWGKHHMSNTQICVDTHENLMKLDNIEYKIKYGESLRAHPGLELCNIPVDRYFK